MNIAINELMDDPERIDECLALCDQVAMQLRRLDQPRDVHAHVLPLHCKAAPGYERLVMQQYALLTRMQPESYDALLASVAHVSRAKSASGSRTGSVTPLGQEVLYRGTVLPKRKFTTTPYGPYAVTEERIHPDVRVALRAIDAPPIEWYDEPYAPLRVRRAVVPLVQYCDGYLALTCVSTDADEMYRVRLPRESGAYRVLLVQDGAQYEMHVSIDLESARRIEFLRSDSNLVFAGDGILEATDCSAIAAHVAGYVGSPAIARYLALVNNQVTLNGLAWSQITIGNDWVIERLMASVLGVALEPRVIMTPNDPTPPTREAVGNIDRLLTVYADPEGYNQRCYLALDAVQRGTTYQRAALYRLFDSFGMNRAYCVSMIFVHQHALLLTHTPRGYTCIELQTGYARDAYDRISELSYGRAFVYFYVSPRRAWLTSQWTARDVRRLFDPFDGVQTPKEIMQQAYALREGTCEAYLAVRSACSMDDKPLRTRRALWRRAYRLGYHWARAWVTADWPSVAKMYAPEVREAVGDQPDWRVVNFHLLIRTGVLTRDECIDWHRIKIQYTQNVL